METNGTYDMHIKKMEPIQTCCLLSRLELHVGYSIWTPICRGRIICSVQIQSTFYSEIKQNCNSSKGCRRSQGQLAIVLDFGP